MTTTPQAALLVSDLELRAIYEKHKLATADLVISDLRRILIDAQAAILAKLQPAQAADHLPEAGKMVEIAQTTTCGICNCSLQCGDTTAYSKELDEKAAQAGELPDEREAFERFAQNCPMGRYSINRRGDGYGSSHTQIMWDAWQARAALAARKPLTPTDEQVRHMASGKAIERAAKDLPDGYELQVIVERGAGWATVTCPDVNTIAPTFDGDHTLAEQVDGCTDAAIRHAHGIGLEVKP